MTGCVVAALAIVAAIAFKDLRRVIMSASISLHDKKQVLGKRALSNVMCALAGNGGTPELGELGMNRMPFTYLQAFAGFQGYAAFLRSVIIVQHP